MKIELDVKEPGNNTNENHGTIGICVKGQFAYIRYQGKDIIVDVNELYKAISALC